MFLPDDTVCLVTEEMIKKVCEVIGMDSRGIDLRRLDLTLIVGEPMKATIIFTGIDHRIENGTLALPANG